MKKFLPLILAMAVLLAGCGQEAATRAAPEPVQSHALAPASAPKPTSKPTPTPAPAVWDGSNIRWQDTPQSSCFVCVGYDSSAQKLAVTFRTSEDRVYVYSDFSQEDWDSFISADSLGSYYNKYIKGNYNSERYDDWW